MRKLKNDLHALKTIHGTKSIKKVTEILNNKPQDGGASNGRNNSGPSEDEIRKQQVKKRERKALDKSFKLA